MHLEKNSLFFIFLALILDNIYAQMSFVLKSSYGVNPNYAKSTASVYTFPFNAYNTRAGIITLRVDFPNLYQLTTASNCSVKIQSNLLSGTTCSFDGPNNQVVIGNINLPATFTTIDIQFTTATAKYSSTTTVDFLFYNQTTNSLITSNSQLILIQNAAMNCSLTSNSTIVGASSIYTITFLPSVQIEANSVVQLQFDTWGPFSRSNFGTANSTSVCSGQCTINLLSSFQVELVVFSSLYSTSSNISRTITLNSVRNPASFAPIKLKITITGSDGSSTYMIGNTVFSASTTNTFNSLTFDLPNKAISAANTNINLRITPRNPINWNTYLRITYVTPQLTLSYIYAFNSLLSVPTQLSNQPAGQMLISSLTRTTITTEPTLLSMGNFTLVNPPFAQKPVAISFRTEQLIGTTYYSIDQTTVQVTSNPSNLISFGVSPNIANIGSVTIYNIWFVLVNKLGTDSFFNINFPSQIKLTLGSSVCTLTNSGIVSSCLVDSSSSIKVDLDSTINSGVNMTVTVTFVVNPLTTTPTDSFIIRTYFMDNLSLVDQLTTGLIVNPIQVPLRSVTVTPTSVVVYARNTYTFTIQSSYDIPTSSIIKITFPQQIRQGGQSLLSFSIDSVPVSGCILSVSNNSYIQFSNLCIKSIVKNTSTITILISNVVNPTSFKPTSSFIVQIFNGIYKQEYLNTGIIVTMSQTATIPYFKVTPDTVVANQVNTYTFEANFVIRHYSGDRVLIKFPTQIQLSQMIECSSLTVNMTISCSKQSSDTLLFILNYISSVYPIASIKFTFSNFTNVWYATTKSFIIQTTTNDTTYYYQQQGLTFVNYQAGKIASVINNDNNIVLLGTSQLTIGLTSPFALTKATNLSLIYIVLQVPTDFTPLNGSCISSYAGSNCQSFSTQILNITNLGDFSSPLNIKFSAQTTFFQNSSNFDIKLYYESSLVLAGSQLRAQKYCQSPCKQCTSTKTECFSCLPSPYVTQTIYFSFNSSCVNNCPDTYYLNTTTKSCGKCNSLLCKTCQNDASTCTSCNTGKYLFNKTCFSVCPNGYYAFNGECLACISPCLTCLNSGANCLSCINTYFLDIPANNNSCVKTCTNTNYLGIDGTCRQCTNECKSCSIILSNCTSCDQSNYRLYNYSCVRNCPSEMYSNSIGACVTCESPCRTCSSKTACQSCTSNYYLYNGNVCTTQCPNGFLALVNQCVACDSKCATCSITLINCTSCPSGKLFYLNDCLDQCPPLTYPYNKTCTRCITPCVTCASSPQVCLSCISGLLLLNSTCVPSCPLSGYIIQDGQCLACPSNCLTCSNSINCTLCGNQYYLLQGGCVQACPVNYPIVQNRQCFLCDQTCLTCSTTKQNCTSCRINLFKYRYTCVQSCPIGYYSDSKSYECQDGLGTKIAFFPILIVSIIMIVFIVIGKFVSSQTSLATSLTSILSLSQLAIWIFVIGQLTAPFKQLNVDYSVAIAMFIVAMVSQVAQNIAYFFLCYQRMQRDNYVKGWAINNVNYTVLTIHRYAGLILNFKFFRLVYSRFWNIRTLSLPFVKNQNIFPLTTVFSLLNMCLCQIPMIVGSFSLAYNKLLKDQLFYTSIQCLIVTVTCLIFLLIDIYKPQEYFQESDYVKTKKYLQKIKDASFNRLEDTFDISKDQGSIQGQKYVSRTGGKFVFTKEDPSSMKQLFFQQQVGSTITDGMNSIETKGPINSESNRNKSFKKINIFDPIKQEDQQIYEDLKYSQQQIKTQAQIEQQKRQSSNLHKQHEYAIHYSEQKSRRARQFGINTDDLNFDFDDNRSMIQQRPLKQRWNDIITHRQRLAKSIFNTIQPYSTKQLQKIIEPIDEIDQNQYDARNTIQDPFRSTQYGKSKKNKRRKKKMGNIPGNSELQKIYLQRLTQKKQYKDIFASSQSIKYDF